MFPILIKTKYITIYSWGLFVALGFLASLFVSLRLAKKEKISSENVIGVLSLVAVSSIIGARIFFVIQYFGEYIKRPLEIFMIQKGGLVFLGGFIAAFIVVYIYSNVYKLNAWKVFDLISPGVILGYAIGRIGCFLNGCCYGIETDLSWAVKFPEETYLRHPTQLYSAFAGFIMFILLVIIFRKRKYDGQVLLFSVLFYSIYRFLIEFVRYSPVHLLGLTPSQHILIVMFVISAVILWKKKK